MTLLAKPEEQEFEVIEFEDEQQEIPESEKTLQSVFSTLTDNSAEVLVKVYKINEMGREAHCFDTTPDEMEGIEDRVRDAYGKGDYRLKAYAPTGDVGRKSIRKVVKMAIEVPKEPLKPKDTSGDIRALIVEMQRNQAEQQTNMMHMFKEQQMEAQNRMTENQMRMQELLIQAMGNRPEQVPLTEQLAVLKQLQPEQKDPMEMMSFMFEMNSKFKEMSEPVESTPLGELSNGINSLVKLAAHSPQKQGGSPETKAPQAKAIAQQPAQPAQPAAQHQQPMQPPQKPEDMNLQNPFVRATLAQHLKGLVIKAEQDKNPEVYADLILEEIPPQFYNMLIDAIGEDNQHALNTFGEVEPSILKHPDWFGEFADRIRDVFNDAHQQMQEQGLQESQESGDNSFSLDSNQQSDVPTATTNVIDSDDANESHLKGDSGR